MKILAIESSGLVASVAVSEDNNLIAEYTLNYKATHSQTLMPMIEEIRDRIGLDLSSIDAIAISNGPGSFTGLRIGSASAKGLGFALNKPLIEVSTVEALAYNLYGFSDLVCPIMDARRGEVYTGIFEFVKNSNKPCEYELNVIMPPTPMAMTDLINKLNELGRPVVFTGDGIDVHKEMIISSASNIVSFAPLMRNRQSAATLAYAAFCKALNNEFVNADESAPVYLRLSQAERERLEKDTTN